MTYTYWFEIVDENSNAYGEEFFTEMETDDRDAHIAYAQTIFPDTKIHCWGRAGQFEIETMGFDTY